MLGLTVWGLPALGDFPSTGEMTFFNPGGFPYCWGNVLFSFQILTMLRGYSFFVSAIAKFHADYKNISFTKYIFGLCALLYFDTSSNNFMTGHIPGNYSEDSTTYQFQFRLTTAGPRTNNRLNKELSCN